jgi:hypothetical protein
VGTTTVYGSDMTFSTPAVLAVTASAVSNLTTSGVTLNGALSSTGGSNEVSVSFDFGTDTTYGNTTSSQTMTSTRPFSSTITGLTANTTYHFRAKAVGTDTVYSSDLTFTTLQTSTPTPTPTPSLSPSPSTSPRPTGTPAPTSGGSLKNYLLPGMEEDSLVVFDFDNQASFASAVNEAGLEVLVSDFKGQGVMALARYSKETVLDPAFSDAIAKGGTGKPSIKFQDVFVEGVRQGTAAVTVYFTDNEIQDFDPASLFLAYYFNSKWTRCSNINVSLNDLAVTGDIPINRLTGTVVGLGGSLTNEIPAVVLPVSTNPPPTGNGIPWSLAGIMIGTAVVIGGVILVVERKRRKNPNNNY